MDTRRETPDDKLKMREELVSDNLTPMLQEKLIRKESNLQKSDKTHDVSLSSQTPGPFYTISSEKSNSNMGEILENQKDFESLEDIKTNLAT
jgi:hypothetical protein